MKTPPKSAVQSVTHPVDDLSEFAPRHPRPRLKSPVTVSMRPWSSVRAPCNHYMWRNYTKTYKTHFEMRSFPTSTSPGHFSQRFAMYFGTFISQTPREEFVKSRSRSIWLSFDIFFVFSIISCCINGAKAKNTTAGKLNNPKTL